MDYIRNSIPPSQGFHIVSIVPLTKPMEKDGATIYAFFRPMGSYATLADAQKEIRALAENAPRETFYIAKTGNVNVIAKGMRSFSTDDLVLDNNPHGFTPNSEAQKALLREEKLRAEELRQKQEELEEADNLTEKEGTIENYIKKRVVTSTLFDNLQSLERKIRETKEKLSIAASRMISAENQSFIDNWLDIYNAKRKEARIPPHSDSIQFSQWIKEEREKAGSSYQE